MSKTAYKAGDVLVVTRAVSGITMLYVARLTPTRVYVTPLHESAHSPITKAASYDEPREYYVARKTLERDDVLVAVFESDGVGDADAQLERQLASAHDAYEILKRERREWETKIADAERVVAKLYRESQVAIMRAHERVEKARRMLSAQQESEASA